jgi:CCR4-NOT transcription complex subunit 7/8
MVKILAGRRPLPETWHKFMAEAKALLGGGRAFDVKYMMWHCERVAHLGGLGRVAASLGVRRQRNVPGLYRRSPLRRAIWRASSTRR